MINIFISCSTVQKNIKVYPLSLETNIFLFIRSSILSGSVHVASFGYITPDDDRKLL